MNKLQKLAWAIGADNEHELYQRVVTLWREPERVVKGCCCSRDDVRSSPGLAGPAGGS